MMRLAESILALHEDILEVYLCEEREGQYVIKDEASRRGPSLLAEDMSRTGRNAPMSLAVLLGAASQIIRARPIKLVGVLYGGGGIIVSPFFGGKFFILSSNPAGLFDVMQKVSEALPSIMKRESDEALYQLDELAYGEKVVSFLTRIRGSPALIIPLHDCGHPKQVGAKFCGHCGEKL